MEYNHETIRILYKKLLTFYPQAFREQFSQSMEQTFNDLSKEKRQTKKESFRFILWIFTETAMGILRKHNSQGVVMRTIIRALGSPALLSLFVILPFIGMEIVNRRQFKEDFPFMLFFVLWLNLFAVSAILLPIAQAKRAGNSGTANPIPAQKDTLLTNPKSTLILSLALFLAPGVFPLLDSMSWLSADRLFNGPNPEVAYIPGMIFALSLIAFPISAGIVAGLSIVNTLRAEGKLFAHPIHLLIVVIISFLFAAGVVGLIVDQWPCFMGVPNCD